MLDDITQKLSRYLENSNNNMIATHHNIYSMDKKI